MFRKIYALTISIALIISVMAAVFPRLKTADISAAQTLARELTEGGYRVDAFDVSFEEDFYENIPVGSLLSAKSFDDLANYCKKEFED